MNLGAGFSDEKSKDVSSLLKAKKQERAENTVAVNAEANAYLNTFATPFYNVVQRLKITLFRSRFHSRNSAQMGCLSGFQMGFLAYSLGYCCYAPRLS